MTPAQEADRRSREALVRELEAAGAQFRGSECRCPFHDDHRASAGVFIGDDGVWRYKCHDQGCGVKGDVFDIRAKIQGRALVDVLTESLMETTGGAMATRKAGPVSRQTGAKSGGESHIKVFKSLDDLRRALPGNVVSQHPYNSPTTGEPDLIVFRCETDEGKTYRPAHPAPGGWALGQSPKPWPLYARDRFAKAEQVVIVEGERCCDVLAKVGIVATTNPFGAGKGEHADWDPVSGKTCVLWPDHDEPGHKHMDEVSRILLHLSHPCTVARIDPEALGLGPKQDVVDFIAVLEGMRWSEYEVKAELERILREAKPVDRVGGLANRIEQIVAGRYNVVDWAEWPGLSRLSKALLPGSVVVLAGTPGVSKSLMLLQAVVGWTDFGCPVAIFELEGDREYHLARVLAQRAACAGLTDPAWVRANPEQARGALAKHRDFLASIARQIWTTEMLAAETLEQLADWVEQQARAHMRIVAVDPITAAARTASPWVADLAFLRAIKHTAMQTGCSVILLSHPTKGQVDPSLGTLAGSAAFERFTDCVLTIHAHDAKRGSVRTMFGTTNEEYNRTVRIEKARNGPGAGCRLAYWFDRDSLKVTELGIIVSSKETGDGHPKHTR
jgi:KaiC/GvpD/RAD55 family RecA-like ATPase